MKAFDTDILTEILAGNPAYAERIANVPLEEHSASRKRPIFHASCKLRWTRCETLIAGQPKRKMANDH